MHDMTGAHLRNAHGGESMAHMRYKIWGQRAKEEGFDNVGRLFTAIAYAELIHATNHFQAIGEEPGDFLCASMAVFGLGGTSQNLQGGIDGETFEKDEMYPAYLDVAKMQEENDAVRTFYYAYSAEKIHAEMFTNAKKAVDAGKDIELGAVQICDVCGYTAEGEAPEKCPICDAGKEDFTAFE